MSLVSRRDFLAGSLAVASATLLSGCGGPSNSGSNGGSNGGNGGSSGGGSNGGSNNENNGSSGGSNSGNNGSSEKPNILGDLGKGYQYRPMTSCPIKDYDRNTVEDQGISTFLYIFQEDTNVDSEGYTTGQLLFSISNASDDINVDVDNPIGDLSQKDIANIGSSADLFKKYPAKHMEVKCGSRVLQAASIGGDSDSYISPIAPGRSGIIVLYCRLPKDWTSISIRYTMPYDSRKYANFIVYPEDNANG